MAISTNALTLSSSLPAKSAFPAPASNPAAAQGGDDPTAGAGQGSQAFGATGSGSDPASDTPAANGGPASQTRTAQAAQIRGGARAARPRAGAAKSSTGPSTDPQDAAPEPTNNFGTVMASALARGAVSSSHGSVATTVAKSAANAPATPVQPNVGDPTSAVAWIAQALTPAAADAIPATAPATAAAAVAAADSTVGATADTTAGSPLAAAPAPAGTATSAPPADLGFAVAKTQTPNPFESLLAHSATPEASAPPAAQIQVGQNQNAPADDAPAAAAAMAGNTNALAGVQKLLSGLTGAATKDTDTDNDTGTAAPKTHATSDGGGTDANQAAAALQAAVLSRTNGNLGGATLTIHAAVGSAAFADEVSARAAGLAQAGITQAQLQLNPADLGPVQVHITMQAGQATVWFGATHADTRAALEQSLPRLRELFAGAGMPLTDSGVFREPPQQQQAQAAPAPGSARAASDTIAAPTVTQVANLRLSLLDTYA